MTVREQQQLNREWLLAANGDLHAVEQALIRATNNARKTGQRATPEMVMEEIRKFSL
jgi:hypothetical protein